ncbi:hypothetical protein, partial [Pseudomonas syringae group genomosp. 7]|uniref:hypothetical protein n=1 Tax=Pseudomonas syringae group genomosp. 7 TaxID=251699 RepID=UPI00376FC1F6
HVRPCAFCELIRQLDERLKPLPRAKNIDDLQGLVYNELLSNSEVMTVVVGIVGVLVRGE